MVCTQRTPASKRYSPPSADDFGLLLSSRNINTHLAKIRSDREHYRQTRQQDIAEIESMARDAAQTKRCNATRK